MRYIPFTFIPVILALTSLASLAQEPKKRPDETPVAPPGFVVATFAREPLVRQPCSMVFDAKGRLCVGMGPQYRNPKPDTKGDSVVLVLDTDGDGVADTTKVFATGFNCIQGLAWHGRDLWVANAPDLTIVRDLDGDDEADEYVRVYTDLGNLEHGLHGLVWAPDGKLYMSKGNSKGLTKPGRIAPKPFRDLWGVTAPPGSPDFPEPTTYKKGEYKLTYQDPADDWGREGGILRCDDGGGNLEIVSRGMRNPWDINLDDGFQWLGTDNDQIGGDRVFMPFFGAHFGWNHSWSSHWNDQPHPPTAPVSGPMFEGSGTGVLFWDFPQFPAEYRGQFFINDWLQKTTYTWKPTWDGALMKPEGGTWKPFLTRGKSLFNPTDIEVGPEGDLWTMSWGTNYGASFSKSGDISNEGRVYRVRWQDGPSPRKRSEKPLAKRSVAELVDDFQGPLPVWRIDAADELVRRGDTAMSLIEHLRSGKLSRMQETWAAWTLGRLAPKDLAIREFLVAQLDAKATASLNLKLQALRILGFRVRTLGAEKTLPDVVAAYLQNPEPRLRMAAVEAIVQARQTSFLSSLVELLGKETDRVVAYAGWQGLRSLQSADETKKLLVDPREGVRKAALLALFEEHKLSRSDIVSFEKDPDAGVRDIALLRMGKATTGVIVAKPAGNDLAGKLTAAPGDASLIANLRAKSNHTYRTVPNGLYPGAKAYTDRDYTLVKVPLTLLGSDLVQTANIDDGSTGAGWLTFDAILPVRVHVGIDVRQKMPPGWLRNGFQRGPTQIQADHWAIDLFSREYPAGPVTLGGNTDDGKGGGKGNYIVVIEPLPLPRPEKATTATQVHPLLAKGDARRGEVLFKHTGAAACAKCHSLDQRKNSFGPQLADIGHRATAEHIVQSLLEPDVHITEGFSLQRIETDDGKIIIGTLIEESGLTLTLAVATGEKVIIDQNRIESRASTKQSPMPSFATLLTAEHAADIVAYLLSRKGK